MPKRYITPPSNLHETCIHPFIKTAEKPPEKSSNLHHTPIKLAYTVLLLHQNFTLIFLPVKITQDRFRNDPEIASICKIVLDWQHFVVLKTSLPQISWFFFPYHEHIRNNVVVKFGDFSFRRKSTEQYVFFVYTWVAQDSRRLHGKFDGISAQNSNSFFSVIIADPKAETTKSNDDHFFLRFILGYQFYTSTRKKNANVVEITCEGCITISLM